MKRDSELQRRLQRALLEVSRTRDPIFDAHFSRMAEMDIHLRDKMKEFARRTPLFVESRIGSGSGFPMANIIRQFFFEYAERMLVHGLHMLPVSFNVVEAFLEVNSQLFLFDLRQERDHLLRLYDYFDWYTSEHELKPDPGMLIDVLQEGDIYSFELTGDAGDYAISAEGSKLAIAGMSMIRHGSDLSIILLAGENPPYPSDEDLFGSSDAEARLSPDPRWEITDRYLDGQPGFSRILLLTRVDLRSRCYDLRYILLDCGSKYTIFTDDRRLLADARGQLTAPMMEGLGRYSSLFSALTSLIFLPAFFVLHKGRVVETRFVTDFGLSRRKSKTRRIVKELGKNAAPFRKTVHCLAPDSGISLRGSFYQEVDPPDLTFKSSGFWKPIGLSEIGEDQECNPVVGKTWVERTEIYSVKSPEFFVMHNSPRIEAGEDPGTIYIMRSASHGIDIYKIGLTRRKTQERATEISSSTGVPIPFDVLASWPVSNCRAIEKEVHRRLSQYRVSKRREFFRVGLSTIVDVVKDTIERLESS